jgi:hypothetical protein
MHIKIGEFVLTSDHLNYILNEVHVTGGKSKNPGSQCLNPKEYYTNIKHLLDALFEKKLKKSEARDLKAFKVDVDRALEYVNEISLILKEALGDKMTKYKTNSKH